MNKSYEIYWKKFEGTLHISLDVFLSEF